jgi:hypothetical protein
MLVAAHALETFVSILPEESRSDCESFLGTGSDSNTLIGSFIIFSAPIN